MRIVLLANESCLCSLAAEKSAMWRRWIEVDQQFRVFPWELLFSFPFLPSLFYFSVVLLVLSVITLPRYVHESFLSPSLYTRYNYNIKNKVTLSCVEKHPRNLYLSVYISGDKRSPCNRFSCVVKLRHG